MESNFDKGRALFKQHERAKQDYDEQQKKLLDRSSWTKTEISHWLDDYLLSLKLKLGDGFHIKCDTYDKSVLVMGPFLFGLDISIRGYTLLKESDVELSECVLESVDFVIKFPSIYSIIESWRTQYNQNNAAKNSMIIEMRNFIRQDIKGSYIYDGENYDCYSVKGAKNLELILGFFTMTCEEYLSESAKKSPPWITFIDKNIGLIENGVKLIGAVMIVFILVRLAGIL